MHDVAHTEGATMKRILCCGAACAALIVSTLAADAPKESHMQAASDLIRVMDLERSAMGGATAMVDAMLLQNATLVPFRDTLLEWAGKYLTWDEMGPKIVAIYADTFSEAELREIIAFYKTRTGKKVLETMPDLMRRGAMVGAEVAQAHSSELEQMLEERAKALEGSKPKP